MEEQEILDAKEISEARETHPHKLAKEGTPLKVADASEADDKSETVAGIHAGKLPKGTRGKDYRSPAELQAEDPDKKKKYAELDKLNEAKAKPKK